MRLIEPLQLHHSWPLFGRQRFELGLLFDEVLDWEMLDRPALAAHGVGVFECDLVNGNALTWSSPVYDLFELPREAAPTREETVALYCEDSRVALERLRSHAIEHKRGFTLDTRILPGRFQPRWMRLTGFPIVEHGRVVRLRGTKQAL